MPGYTKPYRLDRSNCAGGLLLYVREDIPSKLLEPKFHSDIECIVIEFNIYKRKWLLLGLYNPKKSLISNCITHVSKYIDQYSSLYDNIILLGDFNSEMSDEVMDEFSRVYGLKSLIKEPTCYKSLDNPSCIDLILTNRYNSFQDSTVIETGISDLHKLTYTILKTIF